MITHDTIRIGTLLRSFPFRISLTWLLTLAETGLLALIPLLIGFTIDGLLAGDMSAFFQLGASWSTFLNTTCPR